MIKSKLLKEVRKIDIIVIMLIVIFMGIFSFTTSPLYSLNKLGQDSNVFLIIGQQLLNGKVPFRDLFENKGPLVYFIEAFPQIFYKGSTSVWILQIFILTFSIYFLDEISRNITRKSNLLIITITSLTYLIFCYEGGNLSEEFSIFFIIISILVFTRFINRENDTSNHLTALIIGICFSSVALIRITDSLIIVAVFISFTYYLLKCKKYDFAFKNIFFFVLGIIVVALPVIIYYICNNSLIDMINGYFLVNTKYVSDGFINMIFYRLRLLFDNYGFIAIFIMILNYISLQLYNYFNKKKINAKIKSIRLFIILMSLSGFLSIFASKSGYFHYLIILLPQLVLSIVIIKNYILKRINTINITKYIEKNY